MAAGPSKSSGFIYQAYDKVADSLGSGLKTLSDLAQPIANDAAEAAKNPSTEKQSSDYVAAATPSAPKFDSSEVKTSFFSSSYTSNHVAEGQIADHRGHEDAASLIFNGMHNFATETDASDEKGIDGLFWGAATVCAALVGIPAISLISGKIQSSRNNKEKAFTEKNIYEPFNKFNQDLKNADPQGRLSVAENLNQWLGELYGNPDLAYEVLLLTTFFSDSKQKRLAALKNYYAKNKIEISDYRLQKVERNLQQDLRKIRKDVAIYPSAAKAMLFGFESDVFSFERDLNDNIARIKDAYKAVGSYYELQTGKPAARLMGILGGHLQEELPDDLAFLKSGREDTAAGTASQRAQAIRLMFAAASSELRFEVNSALAGYDASSTNVFINYAERIDMNGGTRQLVRALLDEGATARTLGINESDFDQLKGLAVACQRKFAEIFDPNNVRGERIDIRKFDRLFKYVGLEHRYQDLFLGKIEAQQFIGQLKELGRLLKIEKKTLDSIVAIFVTPLAEQAEEVGKLSRDATKNPSIENFLRLVKACEVPGSGRPWMADLIAAFDEGKHINVIAHERMQPFSPEGGFSLSLYFNEANGEDKLQKALRAIKAYLAQTRSEQPQQAPADQVIQLCQALGISRDDYQSIFLNGGQEKLQNLLSEKIEVAFAALGKLDERSLALLIEGTQAIYPTQFMTINNLGALSSRAEIRSKMLEAVPQLVSNYRNSFFVSLKDPSASPQDKIALVRVIINPHSRVSLMTLLAQSYDDFLGSIEQLSGLDSSVKNDIFDALPDRGSLGASDFEDAARAKLAERAFKIFHTNSNNINAARLVNALTLMYAGVTEEKNAELFAAERQKILRQLGDASSIELLNKGNVVMHSLGFEWESIQALNRYVADQLSEQGITVAAVGRRPGALPVASSTVQNMRALKIGRRVLR